MKIDKLINCLQEAKKDGYTDIFIDEDSLYGFDRFAYRSAYCNESDGLYEVDLQLYKNTERGEFITISAI